MLVKRSEMPGEIRENMRGGKGAADIRFILNDAALPKNTRLFSEILLTPGSSIGPHEHINETEVYYMLEGEVHADDNGMDVILKAGDVLVTGSGQYHMVENAGSADARLVAVIITE